MLRLRPYKPCDADKITSWIKDEKTFFLWGGERFGSFPITGEDMNAKYLSANGDCGEPDNFYPMTACDGDAVVGHFIMRYLQGNPKILRFGWVIVDAEKRGKGYGREMLRLGLDYAFRVLKVETVTIGVFENNPSAYHCYTSIGFRKSSLLPDVVKQIGSEQWKLAELEMTEKEYLAGPKIVIDYSVRKTIITVQHAQSVHHTNGHAGAWGDWDLTELGHRQATAIGRYLLKEGCADGYTMYVSDLKRAYQTAEEINRSLGLTPIVTDVIREVNAGAGNGQPNEWFRANMAKPNDVYDIDYRSFPDAESDRDLWNRLCPFYEEIMTNDNDRILIVSHGTALSFLQAMLMGRTLYDQPHYRFKGTAGSVSRFDILKDGRVLAKYINRICEET